MKFSTFGISAVVMALLAFLPSCERNFAADTAEVTFDVSAMPVTRAAIDGDGNASAVNRYIMEVYTDDGEVFCKRVEKTVQDGTLETELAVRLPVGQTYSFLFWADHADNGEDMAYDTHDGGGLKNVCIKGSYSGNSDLRDAFCKSLVAKVESAFSKTITLSRPFAQLNVITKDIGDICQDRMMPSRVSLSVKGYRSFNVLTGKPAGSKVGLAYSASPYYVLYRNAELSSARSASDSWTLTMDYLFAADERDAGNTVSLSVTANGKAVSHSYSNIPLQKNYRTNIIGDILTLGGSYKVRIDPDFIGEY